MREPRKLVLMSLFISIALMLHIFESLLPIQFVTPGAKLGLANVVTVIALYQFGFKESFIIVSTRILLGSLFAGGVTGFIYSFSGGMLSLIMMTIFIILFKNNISIIGTSIIGSVFHGLGQVLMAALIINNIKIISYLPVLIIMSLGAGIFVGYISKMLLTLLPKHIEIIENRLD